MERRTWQAGELYDEILDAEKNNEVAYFNAATLYAKYMKDYKKALKTLETYVAENNDAGPDRAGSRSLRSDGAGQGVPAHR